MMRMLTLPMFEQVSIECWYSKRGLLGVNSVEFAKLIKLFILLYQVSYIK
jgi:hypothetical protein